MKKTKSKKSRDTVPLNHRIHIHYTVYRQVHPVFNSPLPSPPTLTITFLAIQGFLQPKAETWRIFFMILSNIFCPVPENRDKDHLYNLNPAGTKGKFWFTHEPKQCSESGSVSQRYIRIRIRILPSSNKNSKKTLNFYCFVTSS
jgi:hypothetical protein